MNCGYARTAIRELTSSKKGGTQSNIDKTKRAQKFREIFDVSTFKLTDKMFTIPNRLLKHAVPFDRYCDVIISHFSKKWHPSSKRLEYIETFSIPRWKELPELTKMNHSMGNCRACYNAYPSLQIAFPGKPVYEPQRVLSLPASATERDLARDVLAELNPSWENKFFSHIHRSHYNSFTRM